MMKCRQKCPRCGLEIKEQDSLRCPRCGKILLKKCSECKGCCLSFPDF